MVSAENNVLGRIMQSASMKVERDMASLAFHAMGTHCRASFAAPSQSVAELFQTELLVWVADFESRYSRFIPSSLVSRINQSAGLDWVAVDPETEQLLALCSEMNFFTRGVFDPTALPSILLWDWKRKNTSIPTEAEVESAHSKVGWRKLQRRKGAVFLPEKGMALDLGGIGKEYAADQAVQLAARCGISNVLVDFGQDVRTLGHPAGRKAWHIGLEDPHRPGSCWTGLGLTDGAVASSGDYQRFFLHEGRRYGHILDPRSGYPVDNGCRAVSVIATTCTLAGILSTSAFILGPKDGMNLIESYHGAEGCLITENNRFSSRKFYEHVAS